VSEIGISSHDAIGRLQLEKLRTQYRQEASWVDPTEIKNSGLKNALNDLYRPKASIGSGSSADALRVELFQPGRHVGYKLHETKVRNYEKGLYELLKKDVLNAHERMIAENVRLDLLDAMGEKLWYSQTNIPKF
ncbi:MAG: hypothetical protein C0446_14815, partial [Chitinophaga sp.]|nr:hypothetical protein [Chitinophaga sp.]